MNNHLVRMLHKRRGGGGSCTTSRTQHKACPTSALPCAVCLPSLVPGATVELAAHHRKRHALGSICNTTSRTCQHHDGHRVVAESHCLCLGAPCGSVFPHRRPQHSRLCVPPLTIQLGLHCPPPPTPRTPAHPSNWAKFSSSLWQKGVKSAHASVLPLGYLLQL